MGSYKEHYEQTLLDTYSGILFNYQNFKNGKEDEIEYDFSCPEYKELMEKYNIDKIAGKGTDFIKAKRLLHYLAPRLNHSSWYDNHIECNSLKLLEYSLDNPEQGINCLNKAKILEECCLALSIYARRVSIMPFSPYDFDNHVVVEIFDRKMDKWVMLDPTTDGLFVDENKIPLSLLEIREKFANNQFVTFITSTCKTKDLNKVRNKYKEANSYICKNLFRFMIGNVCKFGVPENYLYFTPENYFILENSKANLQYRINNLSEEYSSFKEIFKKNLENLNNKDEPMCTDISFMRKSPLK